MKKLRKAVLTYAQYHTEIRAITIEKLTCLTNKF